MLFDRVAPQLVAPTATPLVPLPHIAVDDRLVQQILKDLVGDASVLGSGR